MRLLFYVVFCCVLRGLTQLSLLHSSNLYDTLSLVKLAQVDLSHDTVCHTKGVAYDLCSIHEKICVHIGSDLNRMNQSENSMKKSNDIIEIKTIEITVTSNILCQKRLCNSIFNKQILKFYMDFSEDKSLPTAQILKINTIKDIHVGQRVKISGWIHRIRRLGKKLMFIVLRDGTGYLQCVLTDKLCQKTDDGFVLSTEAALSVYGVVQEVSGNREIFVDYFEVIGHSPSGGLDRLPINSHPDTLLDNRHLLIREEKTSKILRLRSIVTQCFRDHYFAHDYCETFPPTFIQDCVKNKSTHFTINYFGKSVYLSQSSQLYLETACPALGDVFCITRSYQALCGRTRRHLAEHTRVEAMCIFITFDDLIDRLEDLVVDVIDRFLKHPEGRHLLYEVNPTRTNILTLKKPFKRMTYIDCIEWLQQHAIDNDLTGKRFEFGDEFCEGTRLKILNKINEPIIFYRFPNDSGFAESVNISVPDSGTIASGSMKITDYKELEENFRKNDLKPESFYWYFDQRKFGTFPHGGYAVGLDWFMTWLTGLSHIRDVCLYPRFVGRCKP